MRSLWAGILLAVLVPHAGAVPVWADPAGDVGAEVYGTPAPVGHFDQADLLGLDVAEEADQLVLSLRTVAKGDFAARTEFRVGGQPYALAWGMHATPYATLYEVTSFGDSSVEGIEASWDGGLVAVVPRGLLRDWTGSAPRAGTLLAGFETVATAVSVDGPDPNQGFFCCTAAGTVKDAAGAGTYTVASGGRGGDGVLRIGSDRPFRAHNGGQAQFVFDLWATGQPGRRLLLASEGVPAGWSVRLPPPDLVIPASGRVGFQVLAESPSGHVHGGASAFVVRANDGDSSAWTELGVYNLRVPQPSGHHPILAIHSRAQDGPFAGTFRAAGYPSGVAYMNTLLDDPADGHVPVDSTGSSFGGSATRWDVCLDPGLLIGVQLDGASTGDLDLRLEAQRPYGDLGVSATLSRFGPGRSTACDAAALRSERNETVLARAAPVTLPAGEVHLEVVTVHDQAVPPEPGSLLLLEIEVSFAVPDSQGPGPLALQGGTLELPWREVQEQAPAWEAGANASAAPGAVPLASAADEPHRAASFGVPLAAAVLFAAAWASARRAA